MATHKGRLDHLEEATTEELLQERVRRRTEALRDCSDQEIEDELSKRPGWESRTSVSDSPSQASLPGIDFRPGFQSRVVEK